MYNKTLEFPLNIASDIFKGEIEEINPEDFEKNLNYIIDKTFNEKEKTILFEKYKNGVELSDLAQKFGVSYEWVRVTLSRVMKKLSRPTISLYLRSGVLPDKLPIEFLKTDLRFYNGLKASKIDFIEDIVELDFDTFSAIPKIGKKGAKTIIKRIKELGYNTDKIEYSLKIKNSLIHTMKMYNLNKKELMRYVKDI